jgi:hypothetical protein
MIENLIFNFYLYFVKELRTEAEFLSFSLYLSQHCIGQAGLMIYKITH